MIRIISPRILPRIKTKRNFGAQAAKLSVGLSLSKFDCMLDQCHVRVVIAEASRRSIRGAASYQLLKSKKDAQMKDSRLVGRLIDQVLDGSVYQKTSALDSIRFGRPQFALKYLSHADLYLVLDSMLAPKIASLPIFF